MTALKVVHLYPHEMNIYGDRGNVLAVRYRSEQRGLTVTYQTVGVGEAVPHDVDILVGGGGQDSGQKVVEEDLAGKAAELRAMVDDGVPAVMVCGLYQLFGHRFTLRTGEVLEGIGVFDAETRGGPERLIGNVTLETRFGTVVGFENHSGETFLADGQEPLGTVTKGYGNDRSRTAEGAVTHRCVGSYLHGPLLPKNTELTDFLVAGALQRRGLDVAEWMDRPIDETFARQAHQVAVKLKA